MEKTNQMSESIELGILLAVTGGFMDAYSYLCRDQVFANAQTGNMLLLGINISEGNWSIALRYLLPVLAFTLGIAITDIVRLKMSDRNLLHWRQISALFEALVLALVSFFSQDMNLLANSLTSLACGIQVESFRKIRGSGIATTMCIGNLRNATQNICEYWHTKDRKAVEKGMLYYGIIGCFVIGAVIGNVMVRIFAERAILLCTATLFIAFCLMFIDKEKDSAVKA